VLRELAGSAAAGFQGIDESGIVRLMVGRDVADLFPHVSRQPSGVALRVERLSGAKLPTAVDFTVRRGEILGFAGLVSAGRNGDASERCSDSTRPALAPLGSTNDNSAAVPRRPSARASAFSRRIERAKDWRSAVR
jgi:hypothetical protein